MTAIQLGNKDLQAAATLIDQGGVVVFPTDTVYGIGCDPWNADAIEQLYVAKRRPEEKGLPILISDISMLDRVTDGALNPLVTQAIGRFWPGALTLIVPRHPSLPENIAPGDTIAVRLPNLELTRELIRLAGGALATSSANISGEAAAISAESAYNMLAERVAAIVDGGTAPGGTSSTILDCTVEPPRVLREGPITSAELEQLMISGERT